MEDGRHRGGAELQIEFVAGNKLKLFSFFYFASSF